MEKLRRVLAGDSNEETSEERGLMAQIVDSSSLSWSTRIKGFIICFVLGFMLSLIGISLILLPKGVMLFCLLYSLGNILSLMSTLFLMGPLAQLKRMFNETRFCASISAIIFTVLTLVSGIRGKRALSIFFCIVQFLSMTWYSLSYIPYARSVVKNTINVWIA